MFHKITDKLFHHHHKSKEEDQHKPAVIIHSEETNSAGEATHDTVVRPAIVEETVRTDKVVEVQPVIHKEIDRSVVHHVEEHVVEPAAPNVGGIIRNAPIVDEHIHTQVIDEIQPIVHREVAVPKVEKVEEHIVEHVVAPTVHTHQVKETIVQPTVHVAAGGPPTQHEHL